MSEELEVEVTCLGRVLEGEGKITSTLPEAEYESFGEALRQSIAEIDEPNCAGCIDGRCIKCQRNGTARKIRPRKAGAGLSTFAAMALGDSLFVEGLEANTKTTDDLYDRSNALQEFLGNRPSGHDDCGAANGFPGHIKTVSTINSDGPTMTLAKSVVKNENRGLDVDEMAMSIKRNAVIFADVLKARGWNGQEYVDEIAKTNPEAVEVLETKDDGVGGHAEDAVVFVDGPVDNEGRPIHTIDEEKLASIAGDRRVFVINLNEMRRDASLLGHTVKQKAQLLLAGLMHAGGAYANLGDGSHPVFLVQVS